VIYFYPYSNKGRYLWKYCKVNGSQIYKEPVSKFNLRPKIPLTLFFANFFRKHDFKYGKITVRKHLGIIESHIYAYSVADDQKWRAVSQMLSDFDRSRTLFRQF